MQPLSFNYKQKLARNRLLSILLLTILLVTINASIAHTEQHKLGTSYDCKLCLAGLDHTPALLNQLPFNQVINPSTFITRITNAYTKSTIPVDLCNRGPPSSSIINH